MTTFEPGARVVFTHGRRVSPRSTAFFASNPAPTITNGLDVFVHEVMAAMTTAPWSSSNDGPSSSVTGTRACGRCSVDGASPRGAGSSPGVAWWTAGESEAGNDSALDSSVAPFTLPFGPVCT